MREPPPGAARVPVVREVSAGAEHFQIRDIPNPYVAQAAAHAAEDALADLETRSHRSHISAQPPLEETASEAETRLVAERQEREYALVNARNAAKAAREAEAAGEGKAAEYQEERIRFEQQKRLAAIDAHFAARGRHVIQGEGGKQLLSAFHDGRGVQASMMKRD